MNENTCNIALVGLPGCGKSTIGRQAARLSWLEFADADAIIEQRLGCAIKDYFASHGEEAFRDIESQVLNELILSASPQRRLIATGGGIVLRAQNRYLLRQHARTIYLQASPEEIARRLRNDTVRPLMQGADPLARLRELLKVRSALYREVAHYTIDTQRKSTAQVARKIAMQIELMS